MVSGPCGRADDGLAEHTKKKPPLPAAYEVDKQGGVKQSGQEPLGVQQGRCQ